MRKKSVILIFCLIGSIVLGGCDMASGIVQETDNYDAPETGGFIELDYYPGYSDMEGGRHSESIRENDDGEWVIEVIDQETFSSPTVITTYALAFGVEELESFIKDKKILALTDRKDSDLFVTDYHPWSYSIIFDNSSLGGSGFEIYSIGQYKEYSERDKELLSELREKFKSMRGKVISEITEDEEDDY
ncbi:MAG: hypothetical protein K6F73_03270 [Lachnospiraceae bacterium]|nr:hypothetical protein [Lachnospiraceae bacterium]